MNQLGLDFTDRGLSRRTDPNTSHDAADRARTFRAKHEAAIYGAILNAGSKGATAKEIAVATALTDVQVNRRLGAMGERGIICRRELGPIGWFEKRGGCCVWRACL